MLDDTTTTDTAADDGAHDGTVAVSDRQRGAARKSAAKTTTAKKSEAAKTAAKTVAKKATAKKTTVKKTAATKTAATKTTTKKAPAKKTTAKKAATKTTAKKAPAKKTTAKKAATKTADSTDAAPADGRTAAGLFSDGRDRSDTPEQAASAAAATTGSPLFRPADPTAAPVRTTRRAAGDDKGDTGTSDTGTSDPGTSDTDSGARDTDGGTRDTEAGDPSKRGEATAQDSSGRRRRRRGGRRRRKSGGDDGDPGTEADTDVVPGSEPSAGPSNAPPTSSTSTPDDAPASTADADRTESEPSVEAAPDAGEAAESGSGSSSRRRRRRRRRGEAADPGDDDPDSTVVKVRERRAAESEITSVEGSTRLEAKKQRRREGREASRRRAPVLSESEFLARRESVTRQMVIRQGDDRTQIAVLEDGVLVEHYVARESQTSMIGNVYLGRVQNVLPSMEAAFVDIGKGRNAVIYAGEVDWAALGMNGKPRRIEDALSSGQHVVVQVTKDPVGHKGARLTGQISLPGRFLVYVPRGHTSGISRKLPEGERTRLKALLKDTLPADAGVIVRTAAEGATEEQLTRDVSALTARWADIESKSAGKGAGPKLLYGEPDLMIKVVRDLFTEDFSALVVQGDDAWTEIEGYVGHVAPDLAERCSRYAGEGDVFSAYRVDEQIAKAMERKVWLPSGGSLVIDRTEAMTVVDVNTGKFTGSGGNLEETVTKNNLEAAEEFVRQLRLRDIGGIIVVDFIDMVLESNRDLVLRRLVECLSRDRTRHQVAEVTSLGLVQMTRKRIGTGLLEAFAETCSHCGGRGLFVHSEPVAPTGSAGKDDDGGERRGGRRRGGRSRAKGTDRSEGADDPTPPADADQSTEQADADTSNAGHSGPEADADAETSGAGRPGAEADSETSAEEVADAEPAAPFSTRTSGATAAEPVLGDAITPRKKSTRRRATRKAAPPAPAPSTETTVPAEETVDA